MAAEAAQAADQGAGDAVLAPGQGGQYRGMRDQVAATAPWLLDAAADLVGADPFDHLDDGTRFTQPAIYCATVASWLRHRDALRPAAFAGHSFGEFAALACAGAIDVLTGLELVVLRGRLTDEAAREAGGGMTAVLGLRPAAARQVALDCGAVPANDNCPGQLVVSGDEAALAAVEAAVPKLGGETRRLHVRGAFHSPAMAPAVPAFRRALSQVSFQQPQVPVYSAVTAQVFDDPPTQLADSLVSPVRWREVVELLGASGRVDRFVELAPGTVLSKMVRRTVRGVPRLALDTSDVLDRNSDEPSAPSPVR